MSIELKVPMLPESVADATVAQWHKKPGDTVKRDENLVDIETDKVMLEVPSPIDGVLQAIHKPQGSRVLANEVIGVVGESGASVTATPAPKQAAPAPTKPAAAKAAPAAPTASASAAGPAARRAASSGATATATPASASAETVKSAAPASMPFVDTSHGRPQQRVPMTRLRARVAERLVQAQQNAALLTTFNEVNMHHIMELRRSYQDQFTKEHGVKLGFMSFFVKASVEALKRSPVVNASIDGSDIVYHGYFDIGVAVSTDRGLVVPILRDADLMSLADIEKTILVLSEKARDNKLTVEEMTGGTFTISNGGVFGSLLSTPIINPPQSAILGMHKIEERAVVENKQIVIRPMMYLALSYDHRIIDGKESVTFLRTIKELLEDPERMLLDI